MIVDIRTGPSGSGVAGRRHGRRTVALALLALALGLVGCSADPRNSLIPHVTKPVPGSDQPYPNLASVPDKAPEVTPKGQRMEFAQKLEADSASRSYYPDTSAMPTIPAPPPALPQGFTSAEQPVRIAKDSLSQASAVPQNPAPQASAPSRPQSPAPQPGVPEATPPPSALEATLPSGASGVGARGRLYRVAIVLFGEGSSAIDPDQVKALEPVVQMLRRQGGVLQVVGYAASKPGVGSSAQDKMANLDLSLNRANAVARLLMRLGVRPAELIVSAAGDNAPLASIEGTSGQDANERADIYLEQ